MDGPIFWVVYFVIGLPCLYFLCRCSIRYYPNSYRIYRIERTHVLMDRIALIEKELVSSNSLSQPRFVYLNACLDDLYKELESLQL